MVLAVGPLLPPGRNVLHKQAATSQPKLLVLEVYDTTYSVGVFVCTVLAGACRYYFLKVFVFVFACKYKSVCVCKYPQV